MPFASKRQARYMFKFHPKLAREFAAQTDFSRLPERKRKKKRGKSVPKRIPRPE